MSKRYLMFYVISLALVVLGFQAIARQGERLRAAPVLDGDYRPMASGGPVQRLQLRQSGRFVHADLTVADRPAVRLSGTLEGDRLVLENPGGAAGLPPGLALRVLPGAAAELRFGDEGLRRQPRSRAVTPRH